MKLLHYIILFVFSITFIISGCENRSPEPRSKSTELKSIKIDFTNDFKVNPFTGDSVKPIINDPQNDTLISGVEIQISDTSIDVNTKNLFFNVNYSEFEKIAKEKLSRQYRREIKPSKRKFDIHANLIDLRDSTSRFIYDSDSNKLDLTKKHSVKLRKMKLELTIVSDFTLPQFNVYSAKNILNLSIENGIAGKRFETIFRDSHGFIWMTTNHGVSVLRGNKLLTYENKSDKSMLNIEKIIEDKNGNIWFACQQKNFFYDGISFYELDKLGSLTITGGNSIYEDSEENVWMSVRIKGESYLLRYKNEKGILHGKNSGFPVDEYSIMDIGEDSQGNILVAKLGHGLLVEKNNVFFQCDTNEILNDFIWRIFKDSKDRVWFGSNNYLHYLVNDSLITFDANSGLSGKSVRSIFEDNSEFIWIGTNDNGLNKLDLNQKEVEVYNLENGFPDHSCWGITQDISGNIFASTFNGISIIPKQEITVSLRNPFGEFSFYDFLKTADNYFFGGTNFFAIETKDEIIKYVIPGGWFEGFVFDLIQTKDGVLFMSSGFPSKLMKFKEGDFYEFKFDTLEFGTPMSFAFKLYGEQICVPTSKGILTIDSSRLHFYKNKPGISFSMVNCGIQDLSHTIWFGTINGGIIRIKDGKAIIISEKEGLPSNELKTIFRDALDRLWLGTSNGLVIMENQEVKWINDKNGLLSNSIISIVEGRNHNVYIASNDSKTGIGGLSCIKFNTKTNDYDFNHIKQISYRNGMKKEELKSLSYSLKNNEINVLSEEYFGVVEAAHTLDKSEKFSLVLNSIRVNEVDVLSDSTLTKYCENLKPHVKIPESIRLSYDKNNLIFEFSSTDLLEDSKVEFSYILDGWDQQWHYASNFLLADYKNLSHGNYKFKVKLLVEGELHDEIEILVYVSSPWWETWIAKVIFILFGIGLLILIFRWRTSLLRKKKIELENKVGIAIVEIKEQNSAIQLQKHELEFQNHLLEEKNKEIMDSISYAKRIQSAILPPLKVVKEYFENSFILYQPKDIVAGDFYWMDTYINEEGYKLVYLAVADCTGHGVPGAMVSVVCHNNLNKALRNYGLEAPGEILSKTRELVIAEFSKSEEEVKDGMDISLCRFDLEKLELEWAGANNPLWILREGKIIEFIPNKQPVGKFVLESDFITHVIKLNKNDIIYLFSDGLQDQFGGEKGKKFKAVNFKNLLIEINSFDMSVQRSIILERLESWKGSIEQVDDITVIGVLI